MSASVRGPVLALVRDPARLREALAGGPNDAEPPASVDFDFCSSMKSWNAFDLPMRSFRFRTNTMLVG